MGNAAMAVTILNWERFNPRRDVTSPTWFRLQHNLFEHWQFYEFTPSEMCAWIYLLCEASKRNEGGKLTVNFEHAHRVARIDSTALNSAIKKLKANQVIEVRTLRGRYTDVTSTCTTRRDETNETRQNETERDETNEKKDFAPKLTLEREPGRTSAVWDSYRKAYHQRYGVEPMRNQNVNGKLAHFVARLPASEAPEVASFYLTHNDQVYVKAMHPVGLLLRDAEKLRSEWATGRKMTMGEARSAETVDYYREQMRRLCGDPDAAN